MQQSFELTNETGPAASLWHLEWDDQTFALKDPTGALFVTINTIRAHRLIEIAQLYADDKISITEKNVTVTFRKNRVASRAVRELIIQGLRTDVEYRLAQKAKARSRFPLGLGLFFGFGLAFAFYSGCWSSSIAPTPRSPRGSSAWASCSTSWASFFSA